ncbi:uncharacterized protein VP01_393g2 [Puccinia sorghi]|uniref:Uncharacterized protein n=1 Tax=Puccinia sorghi TaxID=27349 RepID=A0A0L6UTB6_9BASI|nr:uncharacterized protein VP01_393g2 [Puccinia sorghi]
MADPTPQDFYIIQNCLAQVERKGVFTDSKENFKAGLVVKKLLNTGDSISMSCLASACREALLHLGVDVQTFRFTVDQHLDSVKYPAFSNVATIIQSASTKHQAKTDVFAEGYTTMDLDSIQAVHSFPQRYARPNRRKMGPNH